MQVLTTVPWPFPTGASHDLSFEVDYPEVPLLLYAGDHDCHPHCMLIASLIAC